MHPGKPIGHSSEDLFERAKFCKDLASFLCLPPEAPSIVTGLEGDWGSGKSSCINMIKESLDTQNTKPIVVEFSPWLISTLDSVIEGFLIQLAASIGTSSAPHAAEAAKQVLLFAQLLAPIKLVPGAEPWASLVQKAIKAVGKATAAAAKLSGLDIASQKSKIERALTSIKRPIVVIIDDVDRLPPEQVRVVFQMLKAVADFRRVSYLIAYDPLAVQKALAYDGLYEGRNYLDKIVQISHLVPRLSFSHRRRMLTDSIVALLSQTNTELADNEQLLLNSAITDTALIRSLTTPRDVVKLTNRLHMAIISLSGEVAFADMVVFQALSLKYPKIMEVVRARPEQFIVVFGDDQEVDHRSSIEAFMDSDRSEKSGKKSFLQDVLEKYVSEDTDRSIAKSLLVFLFPKLESKSAAIGEANLMRIRNRDAFLKMMHHSNSSLTFPVSDVRAFLQDPNSRRQLFREYRELGMADDLITHAHNLMSDVAVNDEEDLISMLMGELSGPNTTVHRRTNDVAAELLKLILKKMLDPELRLQLLNRIVSSTEAMSVSEHALLHMLDDYGIWRSGKYYAIDIARKQARDVTPFTFEELYQAIDLWLQTIRSTAKKTGLYGKQSNVISLLFRWAQLNDNDYSEVYAFVDHKSNDTKWLSAFLDDFGDNRDVSELLSLIGNPAALAAKIARSLHSDPHAMKIKELLERQAGKQT